MPHAKKVWRGKTCNLLKWRNCNRMDTGAGEKSKQVGHGATSKFQRKAKRLPEEKMTFKAQPELELRVNHVEDDE